MLVTDEDTFELFLRDLEAQGNDMSLMRTAREEILAIPTGDPTPVPGTLKRSVVAPVVEPLIVFPPPVHEGWNETPEGKFRVPASAGGKRDKHVTFRELCRQVRHLRRVTYASLVGLTMLVTGALLVIRWNW